MESWNTQESLDEMILDAVCKWFRSREALGENPPSQIYMFLIHIKKYLVKEFIRLLIKEFRFKEPVYTPITDEDFYVKFSLKKRGVYIFGDNAAIIKKGVIISMFDLATSDALQALIRVNNKRWNYCTFVRLDKDFDCGGTGGFDTTPWNIEGMLLIIKAWEMGLLPTKENSQYEWPYIKELCEPANTFLGWRWIEDEKQFTNSGFRATQDKADARLPWSFKKGTKTKLLYWNPQKTVPLVEFAESIVATGLTHFNLAELVRWVRKRNLVNLTSVDWFSPDILVLETVLSENVYDQNMTKDAVSQTLQEFIGNFDTSELEELAKPLKLVDIDANQYAERIEAKYSYLIEYTKLLLQRKDLKHKYETILQRLKGQDD